MISCRSRNDGTRRIPLQRANPRCIFVKKGGPFMPTRLLKTINLVEGVSAPNLTLPEMKLIVTVEIDSELQKLIDGGKKGLRWAQLQDAADKYVKPAKDVIKAELKKLDEKVPTLSGKERDDFLKTTEAMLKKVAIGQEQ